MPLLLLPLSFFQLQLDFAQAVATFHQESLRAALFKYTCLYVRTLGFSDEHPPELDNPKWQEIVKNMPAPSQAAQYFHDLYKQYEQSQLGKAKASQAESSLLECGCFSATYQPVPNKYSLHFNNVDPQGNLGSDRQEARLAELRQLFSNIMDQNNVAAELYCTSWLFGIEAFRRLFPPEFINSAVPRNKGLAQDNGWWGQFLDRHNQLKPDMVEKFRANFSHKKATIDEYFPLMTLRAHAPLEVFYEFYGVK